MPRDYERNVYHSVALPKALEALVKEKAQRLGLDVAGYLKYLATRDVDPGILPAVPAQEMKNETNVVQNSLEANARQAASAWADDDD